MINHGIPKHVLGCIDRLQNKGYQAYLVGGSVRDLCLGFFPKDFDLCTDATPDQIEEVFAGEIHKTYGKKHGTVGVLQAQHWIEITTFRKDGTYTDHRRPENVVFTTSLQEDLERRDFTINAMAMDENGKITDYFRGMQDLDDGILRCVGSANQRFQEDALRILRALRFASRFGFTIEEKTSDAIRRYAYLLKEIASERIREELKGILLGDHAGKILCEYDDVMGMIIPELEAARGFVQFSPDHYEDVYRHTIRVLSFTEKDITLRLAALFHDLSKPQGLTLNVDQIALYEHHAENSGVIARNILESLHFEKKLAHEIGEIIALHETSFPEQLPEMCRWLAKTGEKVLLAGIRLKECDLLAMVSGQGRKLENCSRARSLVMEIKNRQLPYQVKHLDLNGDDLLELGFKGKRIQTILEELLECVLDNKVANRNADLRRMALALDTSGEKP